MSIFVPGMVVPADSAQQSDGSVRQPHVQNVRDRVGKLILGVCTFWLGHAHPVSAQQPQAMVHRFERVAVIVAGNANEEAAERSADFLAGEAERQSLSAVRARELRMFPRGALTETLVQCESDALVAVAAGRRAQALRRVNTCLDQYQRQTEYAAPTRLETTAAVETCYHGVRASLESQNADETNAQPTEALLTRCNALFPGFNPSENQPRPVHAALARFREAHPMLWQTVATPEGGHLEVLGVPQAAAQVPRAPSVNFWACVAPSDQTCLAERITRNPTLDANDARIVLERPFVIFKDGEANENAVVRLIASSPEEEPIHSIWIVRVEAGSVEVRAYRGAQRSRVLLGTLAAGQGYSTPMLARVVTALLDGHNRDFRSNDIGVEIAGPNDISAAAPQTSPSANESHFDWLPIRFLAAGLGVTGFGIAWSLWLDRVNRGTQLGGLAHDGARTLPVGLAIGTSAFSLLAAALLTPSTRELSWWSWILGAGGLGAIAVAAVEYNSDGTCARSEANVCLEVFRTVDHGTMWLSQGIALLAIPVVELIHIAAGGSDDVQVSVSPTRDGVWAQARIQF